MHIEPGLVDSSKIVLSYATAAAAGAVALRTVVRSIGEKGPVSLLLRSAIATVCVFIFFEVMPHFPVGVSEVHFILGSTLFLILGAAPSAVGLAMGLLIQGLFFSPIDLPQYGMNVTTLLVPLFALYALAGKVIAPGTAYVDLKYSQALTLSTAYQGGVVAWVAFWAIYGAGFSAANLSSVASFRRRLHGGGPDRAAGRSRDPRRRQVVACAARLAAGDAAALSRGLIGTGSRTNAAACRPRFHLQRLSESQMIELLLVGIGTGNPEHLTLQAIRALNSADLILIPRKGADKADLAELRRSICAEVVTNPATSIVEFDLPRRDQSNPTIAAASTTGTMPSPTVWSDTIKSELSGGGSVALLVWGDPALYDSTLRIASRLKPAPSVRSFPASPRSRR